MTSICCFKVTNIWIGVVEVLGTITSNFCWDIVARSCLAESSQPSSVANDDKNSPPPDAMLALRSWKFTSAKAACSRCALTTPPETQLDVPEVMPKVCEPKVPLVVAARICLPVLFSFPNTNAPRPQPAIPY